MSILKISFFLRSPSVGWKYKEANNRELAEDLTRAMQEALAPSVPVCQRKGSVQHHFYVATQLGAEQQKTLVHQMLEKLIPDEKIRRMILVSVTEPDRNEIEDLRKAVDPGENKQFWEMVEKAPPAPKKEEPLPEDQENKSVEQATEELKAEVSEKPEKPKAPEEPMPLSAQAKRIWDFRENLLKKIHGQRHAVDEVVKGIFESEMFGANNPGRKGPLATFLFTGPSGVGKTFLASQFEELLGRKTMIVDMSEYSDNLANGKFNGEFNQPAIITGFVRAHPDGVIVFDEIEKAHINAIHMFLQILDGARMMDHKVHQQVSFKNNIIIMTTNAGKSLYEDTTVCDLSATPVSVILEALRTDVDPNSKVPYFPECITTRMANGNVILFNHLEPYALLQIVKDEIALQMELFMKSAGVKVNYDPMVLAATVLYNGGGTSDARTLRGLARSIVAKELQEEIMQLLAMGSDRVDALKEITVSVDTQENAEVSDLFISRDRMQAVVLTDHTMPCEITGDLSLNADFTVLNAADAFKRRIRGVTDYVLIDPLCGNRETDRLPNDVEDLDSLGMAMFDYVREFAPEIPVYILDTTGKVRSFDTLLARGARGVVALQNAEGDTFRNMLKEVSFGALVNNAAYSLTRTNKFLSFNCAQYFIDEGCAVISFEKMLLKSAPRAGDGKIIAQKGENNNLKFADVIGCRAAKEALSDYRDMLENPRKTAMEGKKMPRGVLLYGPPGTGKTMLAKAMANECKATFIPTSATAFFSPYVGQTEINIRELFKKARKYAPSIIFIDEVDAIGRMRTGTLGSNHNADALNTFLAEMDGFVSDERRPVFILAATNFDIDGDSGRVLDPAFVRRFDSKLLIPLPDTDDRYELLKMSLKRHGIHFGEDHDKILRNMAKRTGGMNNADLEMINANYVRTLGDKEPTGAGYMDSLDSYRFGEVNKMDPDDLRQTAYHEAGHALVCRLCGVTPSFLTIVSRGNYGGFMESAGEKSKGSYTYQELMDRVCRCLAGRVAEIEVYGDVAGNNTGASSDLRQARYYMKVSLNDYAMGDKLYARWTQDEIEQQMQQQYQRTFQMIRDNRATLDALTELLVQQKSIDQTQLEAFFKSVNI